MDTLTYTCHDCLLGLKTRGHAQDGESMSI